MLQDQLKRWVAAGLISDDQAARILEAEQGPPARGGTTRIPLIAEALGYLGGALAIIAALILAQEFWADLETWGRLAVLGVVTVALIAGGMVTRRSNIDAVSRLGGFLWFLAAGGAAFWFGILGSDALNYSDEGIFLTASLGALAVAAPLWIIRRKALQEIATFAGFLATALALIAQFEHAPEIVFGLVVWGIGVLWGFLAWGEVVKPTPTGLALGIAAALIGPTVMQAGAEGWPLLIGLATAGALLVASITVRETLLLAGGAVGVFLFVPQTVFYYFGETLGAPVALLITGALLIGGALAMVRMKSLTDESTEGDRLEPQSPAATEALQSQGRDHD